MLNTIAECTKELVRIDKELSRLNLERRHVLAVQSLLRGNPSPTYELREDTMQARVIKLIRENPGISGQEVRKRIPEMAENKNKRNSTHVLSNLRVSGRIENRGGRGLAASWYVKEN